VGVKLAHLAHADWRGFRLFVLAPGVPLTHPKPHWTVPLAKEAGVEIIGDIELFCRERAALAPRARLVAITGANGKSTTTALLSHILREAGREVEMGGNIGVPVLELAPPSEDTIHVVECSSFQIDLAPSLNPSIGALLNITPDHLDRHGTLENYAAIKERLVAEADVALVGVDDAPCRAIVDRLRARGRPRVVAISALATPAADIAAALDDADALDALFAQRFDVRDQRAARHDHVVADDRSLALHATRDLRHFHLVVLRSRLVHDRELRIDHLRKPHGHLRTTLVRSD